MVSKVMPDPPLPRLAALASTTQPEGQQTGTTAEGLRRESFEVRSWRQTVTACALLLRADCEDKRFAVFDTLPDAKEIQLVFLWRCDEGLEPGTSGSSSKGAGGSQE